MLLHKRPKPSEPEPDLDRDARLDIIDAAIRCHQNDPVLVEWLKERRDFTAANFTNRQN